MIKWVELFSCYNLYDVLYGGHIYSPCVDAVVVLAGMYCV